LLFYGYWVNNHFSVTNDTMNRGNSMNQLNEKQLGAIGMLLVMPIAVTSLAIAMLLMLAIH